MESKYVNIISKEQVARAYRNGTITLKVDPNMEAGTVAAIGEYWFYFGGIKAEEMNPEAYKEDVPEADIVSGIYDALDDFRFEGEDEYAYYASVLAENDTCWAEVRCDHMDENDYFWRVDAWKTDSDTEEGEVIAYIDDITGRVLYHDPLARVDSYAQSVIQEKLESLGCLLAVKRSLANIDVSMPCRHGRLVASFEPDELNGCAYDAVFVGLQSSEEPYVYSDLAAVRSHQEKDQVSLLLWEDVFDESYTYKAVISGEDIKDLITSEQEEEEEYK